MQRLEKNVSLQDKTFRKRINNNGEKIVYQHKKRSINLESDSKKNHNLL